MRRQPDQHGSAELELSVGNMDGSENRGACV